MLQDTLKELGFSEKSIATMSGHLARLQAEDGATVNTEALCETLKGKTQDGFRDELAAAGVKNYDGKGTGRDYSNLFYNPFYSKFWQGEPKVKVDGQTTAKRQPSSAKTAWGKPSAFGSEAVVGALYATVKRVLAIAPDQTVLPESIAKAVITLSSAIVNINQDVSAKRIAEAAASVEARKDSASPLVQAAEAWQKLQMVASLYATLPETAQATVLADARTRVTDAQRQNSDFSNALSVMGSGSDFIKAVLVYTAPVVVETVAVETVAVETVEAAQ